MKKRKDNINKRWFISFMFFVVYLFLDILLIVNQWQHQENGEQIFFMFVVSFLALFAAMLLTNTIIFWDEIGKAEAHDAY